MKVDLHTHSTRSDGSLDPAALVMLAQQRRIDMLSITDHDTIAAYRDIDVHHLSGIRIIPGIELSTTWRGIGIHILGLNIDLDNRELQRGVDQQLAAREQRAVEIARRLQKKLDIDDPLPAVRAIAGHGNIGRPHFARHLVNNDVTKSMDVAFQKYLGSGKIGDVRESWADLASVTRWITAANGTAVLAHPLKYKLTRTRLLELLDDFTGAGGSGMEVVNGQQNEEQTLKLAKICNARGLLASCGSDFHNTESGWSAMGSYSKLPDSCTPVWSCW